ncbi:hypothetical protein SK803_18110 [Lentzea sp. BCCO 10_0856]|uniref:Protein-tyrosine-phosphatase-like N-terminal domain-containing protein n=1 Tax=Lentzea miocenica TaxID=3095431 RepID=A0ABU4T2F0_9PSEU|nr:hypothetical protein [Lentzea sp. BCCO 10_0856]MDX8032138.1 hypothetical protein [Lentzea sp. BCCO 10_0856]
MTRNVDGHLVRDPHGLHAQTEDQLRQATAEVHRRVGDAFDEQAVQRAVRDAYEEIHDHASIESFLPILVARSAEQKLAAGG